jgi:hypothetical protein
VDAISWHNRHGIRVRVSHRNLSSKSCPNNCRFGTGNRPITTRVRSGGIRGETPLTVSVRQHAQFQHDDRGQANEYPLGSH